ncbi:jg2981 [Pararge aegeria aegeria]|uniref:Jg2981 protein n=1 Tax=Pararge aegeria aegeria TaxID=348720 RepID=A0A8S4RAH5_9NEOP|nr:jg2981 [Pararge aegeria aegeria]
MTKLWGELVPASQSMGLTEIQMKKKKKKKLNSSLLCREIILLPVHIITVMNQELQNIDLTGENRCLHIQLVQTIGHMEFVLKHPCYRKCQEKARSPAVLCPSQTNSQELVRTMVLQALEIQPDAKYFHIGADEIQLVQTIGHMEFVLKHPCYRKCQEKARSPAVLCPSQTNSQELVRTMVLQALEIQPDAKYFHIGADEVRNYYKLGELVQPVVWNYNVKADFSINPQTWDCYRTIFPSSWVASAFKGASGSCENGFIFSIALERKMGLTEGVLGQEFIHTMKIFMKLRDRSQQLLHSDLVATWLNPWQIEHGYTNPAHLELIANESIT